ncbi:MAG: exosortase/archaeosortase family protein, partial [Planctomycetota bacterium]
IMRVAWFPIAFLICALPWPDLVYSKIALPLQFLAANVALVVLNLCQIDTVIEGTTIVMFREGEPPRQLNVAEACAGMKSLMTFITAGAAIAFVMGNRPMWQKITIVLSAIPIAILCNTLRVSVQGLLDFYVSTSLTEGLAHAYVGLFMLIPAFFMLLGVGWMLDQMIIEDDDDDAGDNVAASDGKTAKLAGGAA